MTASPRDRYTAVAIWLHWIIAALVLTNVCLGFGHEWVARPLSRQMIWWHQSFGVTVLLLTLARIGWRLAHPVPPLPDHMPAWEKLSARVTHWGLYLLMLVLPLSGWAMASARGADRIIPFYGLTWPKLPFIAGLAEPAMKAARDEYGEWHERLAWIAIALVVLHVLAALKHQFWNKDIVVHRMAPIVRPGVDARLNADAAEPGREV